MSAEGTYDCPHCPADARGNCSRAQTLQPLGVATELDDCIVGAKWVAGTGSGLDSLGAFSPCLPSLHQEMLDPWRSLDPFDNSEDKPFKKGEAGVAGLVPGCLWASASAWLWLRLGQPGPGLAPQKQEVEAAAAWCSPYPCPWLISPPSPPAPGRPFSVPRGLDDQPGSKRKRRLSKLQDFMKWFTATREYRAPVLQPLGPRVFHQPPGDPIWQQLQGGPRYDGAVLRPGLTAAVFGLSRAQRS